MSKVTHITVDQETKSHAGTRGEAITFKGKTYPDWPSSISEDPYPTGSTPSKRNKWGLWGTFQAHCSTLIIQGHPDLMDWGESSSYQSLQSCRAHLLWGFLKTLLLRKLIKGRNQPSVCMELPPGFSGQFKAFFSQVFACHLGIYSHRLQTIRWLYNPCNVSDIWIVIMLTCLGHWNKEKNVHLFHTDPG